MAGTYSPTGTYSNLTRLELERLRQADAEANGKALTVGDSGLSPETAVGIGQLSAERYTSGPSLNLADVYPITPPTRPGPGLLTMTTPGLLLSEFARWWGPTLIWDSQASGKATAPLAWSDNTLVVNFTAMGVQNGDLLIIKSTDGTTGQNAHVVATVRAVGVNTISLYNLWNPNTSGTNLDTVSTRLYSYAILRPQAVQLFAIPGSGPVGAEQSFLMVKPGSVLHGQTAPTADQIELDRITNIIRPDAGLDATVDRADAIYEYGSDRSVTNTSLLSLGYRVVLYPDNGSGAPDMTKPIASLNPVIDPAIPAADQRMTIDYKAGVVRFSCAPKTGGDIKVAGGVNGTTGRLNLYAVYWAIDLTLTAGTSQGLYVPRSTEANAGIAARIRFDNDPTVKGFRVGTTTEGNEAYIKALGVTEGQVSSATSYPNQSPGTRASTELGTFETQSGVKNGLRYLSYRQGESQWRFLAATSEFMSLFGYADAEMFVADKTQLTVSDASSPGSRAANINPVAAFGSEPTGIRSHQQSGLLTDLHNQLAASPYGTVHLKRGRYYLDNAIHIPPGSILEGEGAATKLIYRSFDASLSSSVDKAAIKVGPNTTWGVYDASAYPDSEESTGGVAPTLFEGIATGRMEGVDTVWNPVRRCWAVVWADVTSGAVFFNEVLEDGTRRFPGLGINVKDNATPFFVLGSPNSSDHSGSHYPRLAYQEHTDEYVIVWVEEFSASGVNGSRVAMRWFRMRPNASQAGWHLTFPYATVFPPSTANFCDHPSVAVENYTTDGTYRTCLVFWSYSRDGLTGNLTASLVNRRYYQSGSLAVSTTSALSGAGHEVVSSTDVASDENGGFLAIWSVRTHTLLQGNNGTITVSGSSYLTAAGYNWAARGVLPGSKVHILSSVTSPTVQQSLSGVVVSLSGAQATIKYEGGSYFVADGPNMTWAITPASYVQGKRSHRSGVTTAEDSTTLSLVATASPGTYQIEMREPDYVRISRGSMSWCVAFQGFNTNAFPAKPFIENFENGYTATGPTHAGIVINDPQVYREHVSTCAIILRDDGNVVYPNQKTSPFATTTGAVLHNGDAQFDNRVARDLEVSLKSLGTRSPITVRPNHQSGFRVPVNYAREVSFLSFSYRWTTSGVASCIPDVTWSGQDWSIVSPAKTTIHSYTGTYGVNGGNSWLTDGLFYFGSGSVGTDNFGWFLHRSIPAGSYIYFPGSDVSVQVTSAADEHTLNLPGHPLGASPLQVEWVLLSPASPLLAGAKNQGFRVGLDGELLTSTSFVTMADLFSDNSTAPREVELMRRPQARGGNYPAVVAGTSAGESADRLQAGSRHRGNIAFRGVAPGRPKGMSRYAINESPMVALAWSENLYGLIDRVCEGTPGSEVGGLEFYRQSYGPYNVTLRNLSIEATSLTPLAIRSRSHVYTRHYAPVSSALSFATDGYRNVYVYPVSRVFSPYAAVGVPQITSGIGATYTNAKGQDPLYMDGPILGRGDLSQWSSDISWENAYPTYMTNSAGGFRYAAPGTGPKVLWDGQRFALFWVERANQTALNNAAAAVGFFLCMSYLPGSEDTGLQTSEMVDAYEVTSLTGAVRQSPLASVHISDGTGFGGGLANPATLGTVAVCEAAFSGKVYAVVWVAGLVPNAEDSRRARGSTLGVTLFNMDSAVSAAVNGGTGVALGGGGTSFVIEQSAEPGSFQNPKIIWDGVRFVIFFETVFRTTATNPPTLASLVSFAVMSEEGMARPVQVKQTSGRGLLTGGEYATGYAGALAPYLTQPLGAGGVQHSLGFAAKKGTFASGTPFWSAGYTSIFLFGNTIGTSISFNSGASTLGVVLTDGSASFINDGVRPGDYLFIVNAPNKGYYMIVDLDATTITVTDAQAFVTNGSNAYSVLRYQQPNVQPGDQLVVSRVVTSGTNTSSSLSAGVYPVINYDPRRHLMTIQGTFDDGDVDPLGSRVIYGTIQSAGTSDYDNAPTLESARSGVSPRSAPIQRPNWASGASTTTTGRLHGVAYNDVTDEFAVLVQYEDNTVAVYGFQANTRATTPEVLLNDPTVDGFYGAGDIAWNGASFLVVAPYAVLSTGKVELRASLLNARYSIEATTTLHPNTFLPDTDFLFGNAVGQIPGPGYGAFPSAYSAKAGGIVWPFVSQMKVIWNARMSRWVVSASVVWYDSLFIQPGVYTDIAQFVLPTTGQTNMVSWTGTQITLNAKSKRWQPGMKIVIRTTAGPNTILAAVTILNVSASGAVGTGYDILTVDALNSDIPAVVPASCEVYPTVREDVLSWTLSQDAAGLLVEDADNVLVEDVVLGGGGVDIEESWPRMARPVWQAAGQTFGDPTSVNFSSTASQTRQPQYNHRLMTPAGKVNLPVYTNVTSAGRHPHGRKSRPGAAYSRDGLRTKKGLP